MLLQLRRADGLLRLVEPRSRFGIAQALKLHRERARPAADFQPAQVLPRGHRRRAPIDAVVIEKPAVFHRDDRVKEMRTDLLLAQGDAPLPVWRGEGGKRNSISILDHHASARE